jgi:3,4-dihydroxy-2-butanone 4-phosphate synthase
MGSYIDRPTAALNLARMAGQRPAMVLCELVSVTDPHRMAYADEARTFAEAHGLLCVTFGQLAALGHGAGG